MADPKETAGGKLAAEVQALVRSRNALLWVVTPEEGRVKRSIVEAVKSSSYTTRMWDIAGGVVDAAGAEVAPGKSAAGNPGNVLKAIRDSKDRAVWILRDFAPYLADPMTRRMVRSLAQSLPNSPRDEARTMVILSTTDEVHPDLRDLAKVVKWSLPDRVEIAAVLDTVLSIYPKEDHVKILPDREAAIDAAVGLSVEAAQACFSKSLVTQGKKIVPSIVAAEKRRVVNQSKGIEWYDSDPRGLDAVGGLDVLKSWLTVRKSAFSERARAFGLPAPRGLFVVGLPGTGKSLMCKAIAASWGVPLLRLDLGAMRGKYVGESEASIRAALGVAEAVGNCVCWIDEIEKSLGGANGSIDGGVSQDALGTLLQWMQERKGSVFVVATANDVRALPPELLRKGRFDEIFFVDLPTRAERTEVLRVTLRQFKRDPDSVDIAKVTVACEGFTGAEIAAIVPDALFVAFADGERAVTTADLVSAASTVSPLARTAAEKIGQLREWAKGRARRASSPEEQAQGSNGGRNLDIT